MCALEQHIWISQRGDCLFHYNDPDKLKVINSAENQEYVLVIPSCIIVCGPAGISSGLSSEGWRLGTRVPSHSTLLECSRRSEKAENITFHSSLLFLLSKFAQIRRGFGCDIPCPLHVALQKRDDLALNSW